MKKFFKNKKNIVTLVAVLTLIVGGITVGEIVTSTPNAKTTKVEQKVDKTKKDVKKDTAKEEKKESTEVADTSTSSNSSSKSNNSKKSGGSSKSSGSSGGWTSYDGKTPYTPAPQPAQHVHDWVYGTCEVSYNSRPVKICKNCGTHTVEGQGIIGCPNCGSGSFSTGTDCDYRTYQFRDCATCGAHEGIGFLN